MDTNADAFRRLGVGALRMAMAAMILGASIQLTPATTLAQGGKRPLDHDVYDTWRSIQGQTISADGRWVVYSVSAREGDAELYLHDTNSTAVRSYERGTGARFTADSRFAIFTIKPSREAVEEARRAKKSVPKDTLGILDLATGEITRVTRFRSFATPDSGGPWMAYLLEADSTARRPAADSAARGERPNTLARSSARRRQTGTPLVLRNLATGAEHRIEFVTTYRFMKGGDRLVYITSSQEEDLDGLYVFDLASGQSTSVLLGKGDYRQLTLGPSGDQLVFFTNRDDSEAKDSVFTLYHWRSGMAEAQPIVTAESKGIPDGWMVNARESLRFSDDGRRLFFGTRPRPAPEPDSASLPPANERVQLDVWHWKDPLIQPMQLKQAGRERQRSYTAVVDLRNGRVVQLGTPEVPDVTVSTRSNVSHLIARDDAPYRQLISWDRRYHDIYLVDIASGERELILKQHMGTPPSVSPSGKYLAWYDPLERAWFAREVKSGRVVELTASIPYPVHNELHDRPEPPASYGTAGWTTDDWLLVYDSYDIWAVDPRGRQAPRNVTEGVGRAEGLRFRRVNLERDAAGIDPRAPLLLSAFDTRTKASGFYRDRVEGSARPERLIMDDVAYSAPVRARDADRLLYTRQSFEEFPDLWVAGLDFSSPRKLSNANPQQADYLWGTAELVEWRSLDGTPLQGILYKPEGFDPTQKYPMLVYFYERMSDELHRFRSPLAGGSSISFSFYVSRGYLVFVPDIPYRIGYPGESAVSAVIPGVLDLVSRGFVDEKAIGVQGHSWGGYQIAYMITKTDIFAAAEAGAPVVNMTSAYGGIRWATGMSRQFQYEQTQSRIGGSLWEKPMRYLENSPLFWADKVNTPLLMLHNDEDGAVPWYQGIEYFVALRRLGRPVWMLNYNGEGHGLSKWQNRRDFAIRMQQFFDHYLKGAPAPVWMVEGIPATQKGRSMGLELVTVETTTDRESRQ